MTRITENYCSKEIYRLLIKKGFDGEIHTTFDEEGYTQPSITLQTAMKWLREVHNKNIILDMVPLDKDCYVLWTFNIYYNTNYKIIWGTKQPKYNTYEEAAEAAIKYCLKNWI